MAICWFRIFSLILFLSTIFATPYPSVISAAQGSTQIAASAAKGVTAKADEWSAPDQEAAIAWAEQTVPFATDILDEDWLSRQQRLRDQGIGINVIDKTYFLLNSPIIKKQADNNGPVRFMHARHAATVEDCSICHHYRPRDPAAKETTRCSACHQEPNHPDAPERIGLKAAYHQQCINCHKDMKQGPVGCDGCHQSNVPDHQYMVNLPPNPEPTEVTSECLMCHEQAGKDMLTSAHWLWRGPSPYTKHHRKADKHGKATTAMNNF